MKGVKEAVQEQGFLGLLREASGQELWGRRQR